MSIIILPHGRMPKGMNKGAYRGELTCPVCKSKAIRYLEHLTRFRIRYRCRKCGLAFQYDISGHPTHPYAPLKKSKWQSIVDSCKLGAQKGAIR